MWTPDTPDDFSRFQPSDIPAYLDYFERNYTDTVALELGDAFIEGVSEPWLELISQGGIIPAWVQTLLRWRLTAQWVYQQAIPLSARTERGLVGLVGIDAKQYSITPEDIAAVPPAIRDAFLEGNRFSLGWVKRLSGDARSQMGDLMSINTLKNRNPKVVVPAIERLLRRDLAAKELGVDPTPQQIDEWVRMAEFKVLAGLAYRANMISVTESSRMQNLGVLVSLESQGERLSYTMPHNGSCPECQRLIDGRVFEIAVLKENLFKNFGKPKDQWVASLPQHPHCRHSPMQAPFQWRKALKGRKIPREGILLEWYGLPGGKAAFEALGLERKPWLAKEGKIV